MMHSLKLISEIENILTNNTSMEKRNSSYLMIKSNENDYFYKETALYSDKINHETIRSKYMNESSFTMTYVHGLNPTRNCYETLNMNIDILSIRNEITNTIPTLLIDPLLLPFEQLGAKVVYVLLISQNILSFDTNNNNLEVTRWMTFECETVQQGYLVLLLEVAQLIETEQPLSGTSSNTSTPIIIENINQVLRNICF